MELMLSLFSMFAVVRIAVEVTEGDYCKQGSGLDTASSVARELYVFHTALLAWKICPSQCYAPLRIAKVWKQL